MSFSDSARNESSNTIWNRISGLGVIKTVLQNSNDKPQLIYKHSHRCSICFLAKEELEKVAEELNSIADLYIVNVINQREVSNSIASKLEVRHESPQVIILKNKKVVWNGSHWSVKGKEILKQLDNI